MKIKIIALPCDKQEGLECGYAATSNLRDMVREFENAKSLNVPMNMRRTDFKSIGDINGIRDNFFKIAGKKNVSISDQLSDSVDLNNFYLYCDALSDRDVKKRYENLQQSQYVAVQGTVYVTRSDFPVGFHADWLFNTYAVIKNFLKPKYDRLSPADLEELWRRYSRVAVPAELIAIALTAEQRAAADIINKIGRKYLKANSHPKDIPENRRTEDEKRDFEKYKANIDVAGVQEVSGTCLHDKTLIGKCEMREDFYLACEQYKNEYNLARQTDWTKDNEMLIQDGRKTPYIRLQRIVSLLNSGDAVGFVSNSKSLFGTGHWVAVLLHVDRDGYLVVQIADSVRNPEDEKKIKFKNLHGRLVKLLIVLQYYNEMFGDENGEFIGSSLKTPLIALDGTRGDVEKVEVIHNPKNILVLDDLFALVTGKPASPVEKELVGGAGAASVALPKRSSASVLSDHLGSEISKIRRSQAQAADEIIRMNDRKAAQQKMEMLEAVQMHVAVCRSRIDELRRTRAQLYAQLPSPIQAQADIELQRVLALHGISW